MSSEGRLIFISLICGAVCWSLQCKCENVANAIGATAGTSTRTPRGEYLPLGHENHVTAPAVNGGIASSNANLPQRNLKLENSDRERSDGVFTGTGRSEGIANPTEPPVFLHYKFLENQHAAFKCPAGHFISKLHVSYSAEPLRSTYFTYNFRFRRQPVSLPRHASGSVIRSSCHGLKHCVGHRACLFQVTSQLCLHDPAPSQTKALVSRVTCGLVSMFTGDKERLPLLKSLSPTAALLSIKYRNGEPVVSEVSRSNVDVFGLSCPKPLSDDFRARFTGQCHGIPPDAVQVADDVWRLAGRAPSASCRAELLDVYCAYQYNSSGGCFPRFFLRPGTKPVVRPRDRTQTHRVAHRVSHRTDVSDQSSDSVWHSRNVPEQELNGGGPSSAVLTPARIGFVILVVNHPTVALQLIKSLFDPLHYFVLHVDVRAEPVRKMMSHLVVENFVQKGFRNVRVLPKKRSVVSSTASYGIVQAQLVAMEELLSMGHWDFAAVSLSEHDMALRSVDDLAATLAAHRGSSFTHTARLWSEHEHRSDLSAWHQCRDHDFVFQVGKRSRPTLDIRSTAGQPAVLSRDAAEVVVKGLSSQEVSARLQFTIQTSLNAAEIYIPTLLAQSRLRGTVHDSRLMVMKSSPSTSPEALLSCPALGEVDVCVQEIGVFAVGDMPFLRRMSFESMFARRFENDADDAVRDMVSTWVRTALSKHVQKSFAGDTVSRLMSALVVKSLLGPSWRSEANLSAFSSMRAVPQLVPGQRCCAKSKFVMQAGLLGQVSYVLDFSVKLKGSKRRKRVRGSVSQLARTQCFPGGHVAAMLMGTRFLVRDGRHSPWASLVPSAWDPSGNTSVWVMVVLSTDTDAGHGRDTCSVRDFMHDREAWHRKFPRASGNAPRAADEDEPAWSRFSAVNTSLQFTVHLVDPAGATRCQRPYSVLWRKAEVVSWQSWRFFSCGVLEPGLWTARLVPVGQGDQQHTVYESHVFLANPSAMSASSSSLASLSAMWTVEHGSFLNFTVDGDSAFSAGVAGQKVFRPGQKVSRAADGFVHYSAQSLAALERGDGNQHRLRTAEEGSKQQHGINRLKARTESRRIRVKNSRPGSKRRTTFEIWCSAAGDFLLRLLTVAAVLYVVLTKVAGVRVRAGRLSVVQAILLVSLVLVALQTGLHSKLP